MGGFGAVKLGLKHPELFASVNSHSGVLGFLRRGRKDARSRTSPRVHADLRHRRKDGPEDPFAPRREDRPRPDPRDPDRLRQGRLPVEQNRAFHEHLEALDIPHEYQEFAGDHNWSYWDQHVREAIEFHVRNLGIKK